MKNQPVNVSRAALDDLKSKQIEFLHSRLTSPAARAEWRANMASLFDELLDQPLGRVIELGALTKVIDAMLARAVIDTELQPLLLRVVRETRALLIQERAPIGTFVPPNARQALNKLAAKSGNLTAPIAREIAEHEAARVIMTEVLHDALVQFSDRVNPFVAEWGLPSLLKKFSPFGMGGIGKSIDGMRVEFEKRLEPEIRKFLIGFSRDALRKGAAGIVSQSDTPAFIALRQRMVAFLLEQRFADVLLSEADTDVVTRTTVEVIVHVCTDDKLAAQREKIVREFFEAHAQMKVRSVLSAFGLPDKPPANLVETIADATFPVFTAGLQTPAGKKWIESLVGEFYAGLVAADE